MHNVRFEQDKERRIHRLVRQSGFSLIGQNILAPARFDEF
jgi:hypothetical protein